jgi:hypothetical protein
MGAGGFEFVGYVESINIKGVGPNSNQCLFAIVSKNGDKHQSFLLDPTTEPTRYAAMAALLSAAYAGGKTVRLNTTPNPGGPAYAAEIEVAGEGVPSKK